jgi:hypothetical protein
LKYEHVMMNKARVMAAQAQIDILEWAMNLPADMREASFDAQQTLRAIRMEDA